jgi:CRP-like cAMP-binding protein
VVENENRLLGIAYDTLRKKVAKALVSFQNKYQCSRNESFTIDISRDELASIAGTATESLIRALTEFRHEQLIDIHKDNKIEILNPRKLASLLR